MPGLLQLERSVDGGGGQQCAGDAAATAATIEHIYLITSVDRG